MNKYGIRNATQHALDSLHAGLATMDSADDTLDYVTADLTAMATSAVNVWLDDDVALDDEETLVDRLQGLLIGVVDEDQDGELTDDQMIVLETVLNAAGETMADAGASDADIERILNDWDPETAERVRELMIAEAADMDSVDADNAYFDAVYRRERVVRNGKRVWVQKRVSGKVKLSATQKMALKKARRKAHSSGARAKRLKSMKVANR